MMYGVWEWVRLTSYAVSLVAFFYLALRRGHQHNWPAALMHLSIGLLFLWNMFDLTLLSMGLSTRDTRSFATPVVVFVACSAAAMAWIDIYQRRSIRRRLYDEITEIERRVSATDDAVAGGVR